MSRPVDPMVSGISAIVDRMLEGVGDHPVARQMQGEARRLFDGARALDNVNANRSPLDTPAAHALKVAKLARTFDKQITASLNRALLQWSEGKHAIQQRIEEKINLKPDSYAAAIAARFSQLDGQAQAQMLGELVDENRGPELAAIIKAPRSLTGLNPRQIEMYGQAVASKHAADDLAEIEKLDTVFEAFNAVQKAAGDLKKRLDDPATLAEIERGANAAMAAGEDFDQSLQ